MTERRAKQERPEAEVEGFDLPPEYRLLIAGARTTLTDRGVSNILELLRHGLNWGYVLQLAKWHRISALLSVNLGASTFRDLVPGQVAAQLDAAYRQNAEGHPFRTGELRRALRALQDAGIEAIVLKGAALVGSVYRDPAVRGMSDLDLLVREPKLAQAGRVIRGLGYRPLAAPQSESGLAGKHRHLPRLVSADGLTHIEVHRHLVSLNSPFSFDIADCWTAARPARVADVETRVLSPEDMLMHLCLGFFMDRRRFYQSFAALRQLVDISAVVLHYGKELNRDILGRRARRRGMQAPVHCALLTTRMLTDTPLSAGALSNLRPEGFNPEMHRQFVKRKVLETRPWFFHELVGPWENTPANLFKSALRRLWFDRDYLRSKYWPFDQPHSRVYLAHLRESLLFVGRSLRRPRAFCHELLVDRWMHELETGGRRPPS